MNAQTFMALMNDVELAFIERLIWSGSFSTAKYYIQKYQGSHYTSEEKNVIISLLDDAISKTN
jgi:hypothetical protein